VAAGTFFGEDHQHATAAWLAFLFERQRHHGSSPWWCSSRNRQQCAESRASLRTGILASIVDGPTGTYDGKSHQLHHGDGVAAELWWDRATRGCWER